MSLLSSLNISNDVAFVCPFSRTSGQVRGVQISKFLNCQVYNLNSVDSSIFHKRLVIFVRFFNPELVNILRQRNIVVGYDVSIPNINSDDTLLGFAGQNFDFYIANNDNHKSDIERQVKGDRPVFIIPHHHINIDNISPNIINQDVKTVGFVGLSRFLGDYISTIDEFCKSRSISFICDHPDSRESVVEILKKIDIGIGCDLSKDDKFYSEFLSNRPITKLINYQSFGIPSISSSYKSATQFGASAYLVADSIDELLEAIDMLLQNFDLRKELSEKGVENSQKYNIDKIAKIYVIMIKEVLSELQQ